MSVATAEAKREVLARVSDLARAEAVLYAEQALALVAVEELWSGRNDPARPYLSLEVSMALQVAQTTAVTRMRLAQHLVHHLPLTLAHLRTGQLTIGQGRVIVHETLELPDDTRASLSGQVEARVLPRITGMTPSDTRREVRAAILSVDEHAAEDRRQKAKDDRLVWNSSRPDGRALIGAEQSAEDAGAFLRALGQLADATFDPTDPRTKDQQRADLFTHLPAFALSHLHTDAEGLSGPSWLTFLHDRGLTGLRTSDTLETPATTRRRHKRIQAVILVPVETALDLRDGGAELLGYGPVTGAHARELLATAELRKACTDRHTGRILALDPIEPDPPRPRQPRAGRAALPDPPDLPPELLLELTLLHLVHRPSTLHDHTEPQHDPSAALTDLLRLRDSRCTAPGCAIPAHRCDLEHWQPHPTGPTSPNNLGPVSRRCHNAKTHGGWTLTPHPDGSTSWTNPQGDTWTTPARHHPADHTAIQHPRLSWPTTATEIDTSSWPHAA